MNTRDLRFYLNARLHARIFAHWTAYLDKAMPGPDFAAARSRLAPRIFRPYLRPDFGVDDRANLLADHYYVLRKRFSPSALLPMMGEPGIAIAVLTGKSGRQYDLTLGTGTSKEGELSLCFMDRDINAPLAILRMVIGGGRGSPILWIGGLQGAKPPWGRDEIVRATRDLNGLRPKHAVLQASCVLSEWLGIHRMLAPGRSNHISQRGWRKWLPKRKIHADYDSFWQEFGALRAGRDYELPLPLPRRAPEDVASKRRKEWLRRYERLDSLSGKIRNTLESLAGGEAAEITYPEFSRPTAAPVLPSAGAFRRRAWCPRSPSPC